MNATQGKTGKTNANAIANDRRENSADRGDNRAEIVSEGSEMKSTENMRKSGAKSEAKMIANEGNKTSETDSTRTINEARKICEANSQNEARKICEENEIKAENNAGKITDVKAEINPHKTSETDSTKAINNAHKISKTNSQNETHKTHNANAKNKANQTTKNAKTNPQTKAPISSCSCHSHCAPNQNGESGESGESANRKLFGKYAIIFGAVIYAIGAAIDLSYGFNFAIFGDAAATIAPYLAIAVFLISYVLIGGEIVKKALSNIRDPRNLFDENFLMSVASIGAFAIGEYLEAVAVMLLYQIGETLQEKAAANSKKSISALLDVKPEFANLKVGEKIVKTAPNAIKVGDIIVIKAGERIPLDSVVLSGRSALDMSALSGESAPKEVEAGDAVLSGAINKSGALVARVTSEFSESTVSKIVKFVEDASAKKANAERFITKFAKIYTPIVVACAVAIAVLPPLFSESAAFVDWFYKALIFLVVSCPCALVISVPLSFFAGLGGASRRGILIKGGNYLEALSRVETVAFDKTGTLTKGKFSVSEVAPNGGFSASDLLFYAAAAESASPHPIGVAIAAAYDKAINHDEIADREELPGFGARAIVRGRQVLIGGEKLMRSQNVAYDETAGSIGAARVAIDGVYAGYIAVADEIKPESINAAQELGALGVRNVVMLTGDRKAIGEKIAAKLGISKVFSELLPLDKVEKIELLSREISPKKKLVFVGDGINDAPSLARADIGIAMGALGGDIAAQAADVVLMNDNPQSVATAIKIGKKTTLIASQNIAMALGVKALVLTLSVFGLSGMWAAIFADVGVTLLATLNAARAFRL
ncbi:MAG: cadmium-translocating P-type ATPase [Helicobacteraceae bacterium]|jgi:Cd2+/Zn2+-exporting ATPase|nr:cadmium-translocating P-type ATPase [Helicobacteraceae bacterium]